MESSRKRFRTRNDDGLSRHSTTQLRTSLQNQRTEKARLVAERTSLTYRANRSITFNSELLRAFNSLEPDIRNSLLLREPLEAYRQFVEHTSATIAIAEQRVAATKPTPMFYYSCFLHWLMLTGAMAAVVAILCFIASAMFTINLQNFEVITLAICVIAQYKIIPKVRRLITAFQMQADEAQVALMVAQERYNNRTTVAAVIKRVSPYADKLRRRRSDDEALSVLASRISQCDVLIDNIERLIARRNSTSRATIPEHIRSEVWRRDGEQCNKCGSKKDLHFDHIIPHSRGGADTLENLQLLCAKCNLEKGARI